VPWFRRDHPGERSNVLGGRSDLDVVKAAPDVELPSQPAPAGNSGRILEQVLEAVKAKATSAFQQAAAARVAQFAA